MPRVRVFDCLWKIEKNNVCVRVCECVVHSCVFVCMHHND